MKINILGDLHLEFGEYAPPPMQADVVVLAGDIHIKGRSIPFIRNIFPHTPVVYVPGNHEYYRGALPRVNDILQDAARDTHVRFLENDEFILDNVRFLGCALWTNFTLFGFDRREMCMAAAEDALNDYSLIRVSPKYRRLTPAHTAILHRQSRKWLEERLAQPFPGRTVVVTHHAPSIQSVQPHFRDDPVTAAFAENMEPLIHEYSPDLWIHGHTHHCVDYTIGHCRILSNQRGYVSSPVLEFQPDRVVELEN